MKLKHKPLVYGIAVLGAIDALGIAAMCVDPSIVDDVAPWLMLIQLLGVLIIALTTLVIGTIFNGDDASGEDGLSYLKEWALTIFRICFGFTVAFKLLGAMSSILESWGTWKSVFVLLGAIIAIEVGLQRYRIIRRRLATNPTPLAEDSRKEQGADSASLRLDV